VNFAQPWGEASKNTSAIGNALANIPRTTKGEYDLRIDAPICSADGGKTAILLEMGACAKRRERQGKRDVRGRNVSLRNKSKVAGESTQIKRRF